MDTSYAQAFRAKCHALSTTVDLDRLADPEDQAVLFHCFAHYLDMIAAYYAVKLETEKAARKESLHLLPGGADGEPNGAQQHTPGSHCQCVPHPDR